MQWTASWWFSWFHSMDCTYRFNWWNLRLVIPRTCCLLGHTKDDGHVAQEWGSLGWMEMDDYRRVGGECQAPLHRGTIWLSCSRHALKMIDVRCVVWTNHPISCFHHMYNHINTGICHIWGVLTTQYSLCAKQIIIERLFGLLCSSGNVISD